MLQRKISATALVLLVLTAVSSLAAGAQFIQLKIRGQVIHAEVAATPAARSRGFTGRTLLARDQAMLFVFPEPQPVTIWMVDTPQPLVVAFIDAAGRIFNIVEMQPMTDTRHASNGLAQYALEMEHGWFGAHQVHIGDRVDGLGAAGQAFE